MWPFKFITKIKFKSLGPTSHVLHVLIANHIGKHRYKMFPSLEKVLLDSTAQVDFHIAFSQTAFISIADLILTVQGRQKQAFSSLAQLCPTLCDLIDCSTPRIIVLQISSNCSLDKKTDIELNELFKITLHIRNSSPMSF